jgi:hypothetical protein
MSTAVSGSPASAKLAAIQTACHFSRNLMMASGVFSVVAKMEYNEYAKHLTC